MLIIYEKTIATDVIKFKLVIFDSEEKNTAQISNEPIRNKREIPLAYRKSTQ